MVILLKSFLNDLDCCKLLLRWLGEHRRLDRNYRHLNFGCRFFYYFNLLLHALLHICDFSLNQADPVLESLDMLILTLLSSSCLELNALIKVVLEVLKVFIRGDDAIADVVF
jgi:hypothetical protein